MKKLLTVAGSDSSGGAGIQADLKTFHQLGCYGMSALTAVTAQNAVEVRLTHIVPAPVLTSQLRCIVHDIGVDAIKIGMLGSRENVQAVLEVLSERDADCPIVFDPVLKSTAGYPLLEAKALEVIPELLTRAMVVTPNLNEAETLAGIPVHSLDEMKVASQIICEKGAKNVLIKGGHLPTDATDLLFDGNDFTEYSGVRLTGTTPHGTGCTYSAAIAAGLAYENLLSDAIRFAKMFVTKSIENAFQVRNGARLLNHFAYTSDLPPKSNT